MMLLTLPVLCVSLILTHWVTCVIGPHKSLTTGAGRGREGVGGFHPLISTCVHVYVRYSPIRFTDYLLAEIHLGHIALWHQKDSVVITSFSKLSVILNLEALNPDSRVSHLDIMLGYRSWLETALKCKLHFLWHVFHSGGTVAYTPNTIKLPLLGCLKCQTIKYFCP